MKKVWVVCALAVVLTLLTSCGGGGGGPSPGPTPSISLTDASGHSISEVREEAHPSILSKLTGLPPNTPVEIMVYKDGQPLYPQPISSTTNAQGEISNLVLLYDLGVDPSTGRESGAAGNYMIIVSGQGFQKTFPFTVTRGKSPRQYNYPVVWTKLSGYRFACGSVPEGEAVYAQGYSFPPNQAVNIYVVKHPRQGWKNGDSLVDVTGVIEQVTTDSSGFLPYTLVWSSAGAVDGNRDFDLVVDVNRDGKYSQGDAIDGGAIVGFTVQAGAYQPGQRINVVCDTSGKYKTSFTTSEELSFWVNPPSHPLLPNWPTVGKYICVHKDSWNFGDPLIDVSGRPEWDIVRLACINQHYHTVWYPPLIPGHYDPIIDVDNNGVYSEYDIIGHDFLVEGAKPTRIYVSANPATIDPNGKSTIYAQVVDQNDKGVPNVDVSFSCSAGSVNPTSAKTDSKGVATTELTAGSIGGITIVVKASTKVDNTSLEGKVSVVVRAYGGINAIIRRR